MASSIRMARSRMSGPPITFGHCEQPPYVVPGWARRQGCLSENARASDAGSQSFAAPAAHFGVAEKGPQFAGPALNCDLGIGFWSSISLNALSIRFGVTWRSELPEVLSRSRNRLANQQQQRIVAGDSPLSCSM